MKNVHLIPTDKPSRLCLSNNSILTIIEEANYTFSHIQSVHIYITSDEEIKVGDWVIKVSTLYKGGGSVEKYSFIDKLFEDITFKKIILTTDQDLIKDGIQAIDDEFLEWFVKNPSCEEVEIKKVFDEDWSEISGAFEISYYKIIIPKEEPKQDLPIVNGSYGCTIQTKKEETLEEAAAVNWAIRKGHIRTTKLENALFKQGFLDGAKWQSKRMYSEEEVKMLAFNFYYDMSHKMGVAENLISENRLNAEEWFEQFKKHKGGEQ